MITFSNKNHLNKKTKKNDRRWILCFPWKDQKKTPKSKGANQDMALGVEHVYQLWKKAQETAATGCPFPWAYAGWCFSNRDVCFDIESNEISLPWSKSLTIESPEEGKCILYNTRSGGEASSAHCILLRISWFPPTLVPHSYNAAGSLFSICTFQIFILEGGWIKEMGAWINGWMDG